MSVPASLAGQTDACPLCGNVAKVPDMSAACHVAEPVAAMPIATIDEEHIRPEFRDGHLRCQQCGGWMKRGRRGRSPVLGVAVAFLFIGGVIVAFTGQILVGVGLAVIAIVLEVATYPKKVWRCQQCRSLMDRA